ncbi:hypothetical protein QVD17_06132 [Tagetes erecta]|uniref:Replication factor A C-terminal domain-containing protein n=1 Tax=Tagetes erecta TaxID=13708 RepID=A0AAD8LL39_TARER|nr:hypothetical protein QVD17_06132 [Tagetes erecta]
MQVVCDSSCLCCGCVSDCFVRDLHSCLMAVCSLGRILFQGQTFTVYGEINSITDNDWCYIACPLCTKGLSEVDGKWFCPKDDIVDDPVYSYRLSTTITDGHESINATLFNDAVLQLIEVPCSTLAYKNERTNHIKCTVDKTIPITDSIRAKMQIPTPKAPKTPQQLQVIPVQHAPSTAKRQLQLSVGEGPSTKIVKTTTESTKGLPAELISAPKEPAPEKKKETGETTHETEICSAAHAT